MESVFDLLAGILQACLRLVDLAFVLGVLVPSDLAEALFSGSELKPAVGIPQGQSAETHRGRDMRLDPPRTAIVVTLLVLWAVGW